MRGSEKQIAWAEDIQQKCIAGALKNRKCPQFFAAILLIENDARFWIDNRKNDVLSILKLIKTKHFGSIKALHEIFKQNEQKKLDYQALFKLYLLNAPAQNVETADKKINWPF